MKQRRVLVTGGTGFLGRAIVRQLRKRGAEVTSVGSDMVDLTDEVAAMTFLDKHLRSAELVIHCAAVCGGIGANMRLPLTMAIDNARMAANVVEWCLWHTVPLIGVGTVCSYPKHCPAPFCEADLWNGYPEETNAPYGNAKRMLLEFMRAAGRNAQLPWLWSYVIPANLYGPGDNFSEGFSHVIPAMIRRFVEATESRLPYVTCWGTGQATREFLYVDDAADAIATMAEHVGDVDLVNIGSGDEIDIRRLAYLIAELTGYDGQIQWNESMPDGQPKRVLDSSLLHSVTGWRPSVKLVDGLRRTIEWYHANKDSAVSPAAS